MTFDRVIANLFVAKWGKQRADNDGLEDFHMARLLKTLEILHMFGI